MKLLDVRKAIKKEFASEKIDELDADVIISEVLGVKLTELILIDEISAQQLKKIDRAIAKRKTGKPVDKIFKKAYFYGLEFKVDENVLTPRADSEILIDVALKLIQRKRLKSVLDLCTGSGCLAVTIKKNATVCVSASDVSLPALKIAKYNAKKNGVEINFIHSNMFEKSHGKFDLIISNPPYIASDEISHLDREVKFDPIISLDGGESGLDFYKSISQQVKSHLNKNGYLILEIGDQQKADVIKIFEDFQLVDSFLDYGGQDRVVVFKN